MRHFLYFFTVCVHFSQIDSYINAFYNFGTCRWTVTDNMGGGGMFDYILSFLSFCFLSPVNSFFLDRERVQTWVEL